MRTTAITKDAVEFHSGAAREPVADGPMEKRVLVWMAERAPRWVTSDGLTLLGLGAQIGAGSFTALSRYDRTALLLVICASR